MTHWITRYTRQLIYAGATLVITLVGVAAGSLGQQWITEQVDYRIEIRLTQVEDDIHDLQIEVRCQGLDSRVANLRGRIEEAEIALLQADQAENIELENRIQIQLNRLRNSLGDELNRRSTLGCASV